MPSRSADRTTATHHGGAGPEGTGAAAAVLVLGVLPLAAWPGALEAHTWPQVAVAAVGLLAAAAGAARGRLPRPVALAVAGVLAALAVAAFAGGHPADAFAGRYPRHEGLPVALLYATALWAGARSGPDDPRGLRTRALAGGACTVGTWAVVEVLLDGGHRPAGAFDSPSVLGAWALLAVLPLVADVVRRPPWQPAAGGRVDRVLVPSGLLLGCAAVALSGSRAAWAGLVAGLAVLVALCPGRRGRALAVAGGAAGAAAVLVLALPLSRSRLTGTSPLADRTVGGRRLLWQRTLELVGDHPLTGVGPSRFVDAVRLYSSPAWQRDVGPADPPDSAHTVVLQVLAAGGVVLGLAVAVAVVLVARAGGRRWADPRHVGVAAAACAGAVAWSADMTHVATVVPLLYLLGTVVSRPAADRAPALLAASGRYAAGAAAALALAVALLGLVAETRLAAAADAVLAGRAQAPEVLARATAVTPWDPDVGLRGAHLLVVGAGQGRVAPAAALAAAQQACARLPRSVECLTDLADAQDLVGDAAAAERTLTTARAIDRYDVDLLLRLGVARAEQGRAAEAEAAFLEAARLRPAAAAPWENLRTLWTQQGRSADARRAAAEAARRSPG